MERRVAVCGKCKQQSPKVEEIMEWALAVKDETDVHGCMKKYFQQEVLSGAEQYKCKQCGLQESTRVADII